MIFFPDERLKSMEKWFKSTQMTILSKENISADKFTPSRDNHTVVITPIRSRDTHTEGMHLVKSDVRYRLERNKSVMIK